MLLFIFDGKRGQACHQMVGCCGMHLISPYSIIPELHIRVSENKGNDHKLKRLLIVTQKFLVSTSGSLQISV